MLSREICMEAPDDAGNGPPVEGSEPKVSVSGSPVFNERGEVVDVNLTITSDTGEAPLGLGYTEILHKVLLTRKPEAITVQKSTPSQTE